MGLRRCNADSYLIIPLLGSSMRGLFVLLTTSVLLLASMHGHCQSCTEGFISGLLLETTDDGFLQLNEKVAKSENPRLVAIGLDLALGLFGIHRLYLGTDIKVPVAYTLTFGGGGVLWLVDLALLIGSPSIESYKNNPHLFMWIPPAIPQK